MILPEFESFDKIPRLRRSCVITEKIDGSSGQIFVSEDGTVFAGSRNRWVTPENDNMGFARWVKEHESELREGLGIGRHYGEWWGSGIQRRYDLKEKRFSLFNTARWNSENTPKCCHVVPVLYQGDFDTGAIDAQLLLLKIEGSRAAPGFMKPEGIVIYHVASRTLFKQTIEADSEPKGKQIE